MKNVLKKAAAVIASLSIVAFSFSVNNLNIWTAIKAAFCAPGGGGLDW